MNFDVIRRLTSINLKLKNESYGVSMYTIQAKYLHNKFCKFFHVLSCPAHQILIKSCWLHIKLHFHYEFSRDCMHMQKGYPYKLPETNCHSSTKVSLLFEELSVALQHHAIWQRHVTFVIERSIRTFKNKTV